MKYVCDVCGWEYDEALGDAEHGIAPGTKFEDLPADLNAPSAVWIRNIFPRWRNK